jgi:hypothetical protein
MPGLFRFEPCPECCDEPCGTCLDGLFPEQFEVVIDGIVNGSSCSTCDYLNDTFILTRTLVGPSGCGWAYVFPEYGDCPISCGGLSNFSQITLGIAMTGGNYYLMVRILSRTSAYGISWIKTQAMKFDCMNLSGLSIPFNYSIDNYCDGSSATATVTTI